MGRLPLRALPFLSAILVALGGGTAQATIVSLEYVPSSAPFLEPENDYWFLRVTGGDGASRLSFAEEGSGIRVTDNGEPVEAGERCAQDGENAAICEPEILSELRMQLGAGDDEVEAVRPTLRIIAGGGEGDDTLLGSELGDELDGGPGTDTIFGEGGDDTVRGGSDPDILAGADGSDTVSYAGIASDVTVDLAAAGPGGDGDHELSGFESATGGDGDDELFGTDERNVLDGGPGHDQIHARGGDDVLTAGLGPNGLRGGPGRDTLDESWTALDGIVRLPLGGASGHAQFGDVSSPAASSVLIGIEDVQTGAGDDLIVGSAAREVLRAGQGDDEIRGLGGDDELHGEGDDDDLRGGDGDDDLHSGLGEDVALGGAGDDVLRPGGSIISPYAGMGDLSDSDGQDHVSGGDGIDRVDYADRIHGVTVDLAVSGGQGEKAHEPRFDENDSIDGVEAATTGAGADLLRGGPGPNTLDAGGGDDRIEARDGTPDDVRCGDGADTAVLDSLDIATGCETIEVPIPPDLPPPPGVTPDDSRPVLPGGPDLAALLADDVTEALEDMGARAIARRARRRKPIRVPLDFLRPGTLSVALRFPAAPRASGARRVLARGGVRRSSPGRATLRLRLTRAGRRLLRRPRTRRLRVATRFVDGGNGEQSVASRTIRLRRRAGR